MHPQCLFHKPFLSLIALAALAFAPAFAQDVPSNPQPFIIQTRLIKIDFPSSYLNTCIAVLPDGRFHIEQTTGPSAIELGTSGIFEASLSSVQFEALSEVLRAENFKNLAVRDDSIRSSIYQGQVISAVVPRSGGSQIFYMVGLEGSPHHGSRPLPLAVLPLIDWIEATTRELKELKLSPVKGAKPTACGLPAQLPQNTVGRSVPANSLLAASNPASSVAMIAPPVQNPTAQSPPPQNPQVNNSQPAPAPTEPSSYFSVVNLPIPDLEKNIPELRGLKPATDQQPLPMLLEKVGDKADALFHKTPNLISHEEVLQSRNGGKSTRQDFDYLILSRTTDKDVTLEEFRVDLHNKNQAPDDSINPSAIINGGAAVLADLERRSLEASTHNKDALPLSQGFANSWIHFYPANRSQSTFRYLGEQRLKGRDTYVIAFAQVPAAVQSPAELHFEGQSFPIFYQGVAWVEQSDFRIAHLWTDLLTPLNAVHLQKLVAQITFAEAKVAHADPLWLPEKVDLTVLVNGQSFREQHLYSDYRIYGVETKVTY